MTNWEAPLVTRKAEGRPPEPEGYSFPWAQGQNHREKKLNGELWKTVPPSHLVTVT